MTDLLALTAQLVDMASVSHQEDPFVNWLEGELRAVPWLTVDRVGSNLVGRTMLGHRLRLVVAGHTDTVPVNGNARARVEGDTLWGLGSADMKSGLAVMLELARTVADPALDISYVFYAGEEVDAAHNGLGHLFRDRPDLVTGDVALLGEPTSAAIEAGCQGTLRVEITLAGARAHTARPWMGSNAIHRLGDLLRLVAEHEPRQPTIGGCTYREAVQAVAVSGGVAANVVPDSATVTINHRFAPDRSTAEASEALRALLAPVLGADDTFELVDHADGAAPAMDHPVLAALIERNQLTVKAKLGWTDVARFAAHGVPAANFGPGDATVAHMADERVERAQIESCFAALDDLLRNGIGG